MWALIYATALLMKLFILIFLFIAHIQISFAQNYAYTYAKIPFVEYINLLLRNGGTNTNDEVGGPVDGIFLNTGYAFKVKPNFYLETGIDYLLLNRRGSKYFDNPNPRLENSILDIENSVLAFQFRPLWRTNISADNNAFFFAAMGFNFQKQFSNATYTSYALINDTHQMGTAVQNKSKSNFYWATQPEVGFEFRNERNLGFRIGISYSYINWNRSESKLTFANNPSLQIEAHRTSNLFFSFGFVY
jgi:hypothetical protein